ncbi:MAG: hypothetical protein ABEJ56_03015 [Candidatus Nanohaloarchaea archaeon]
MVDEIIYQDVIKNFEERGLSLDETRLYLTDDINTDEVLTEVEGVYIPRRLEGLVRDIDSEDELKRRYTHELGHGLFCENFSLGRKLVQLDKSTSELETRIYGQSLDDKTVTLPADIENSIEVSKEEAEEIANQELEAAEKYYIVNKDILVEYNKTRNQLNEVYRQNIELFEGFSLRCEEEIFGEVPFLEERPETQKIGYERFENLSFTEVKNKLDSDV